uniref:GRF-type domain-containing protein n=1 Tax=Glycine max TaxID=3847 RepID=A0A0R0FQ15_SOYBN
MTKAVSRKTSINKAIVIQAKEFTKDELLSLDSEGRCIITDHTHFAGGDDTERIQFKQIFYRILQKRWGSLLHQGRRIFVVVDLNIAPFAIDRCDIGPDFEKNDFIRCLVKECDILTQYKRCKPESTLRWKGGRSVKLEGSDHAPVFMSLHEIPDVSLHSTPPLSARYVPMESVSKSGSENETSTTRQCNKSNKKLKKSANLDNGSSVKVVNDSCTDYSNNQAEPSQPSPRLQETPTVFAHSSSPKKYGLDTDTCDQDLAGPNGSSTKEEMSNVASLEWQRIQQLMQNSIPICKGYKEPCIARVVKKQGPNFGRRFYVCAHAEGPASNLEANCGYFKWASSKSKNK